MRRLLRGRRRQRDETTDPIESLPPDADMTGDEYDEEFQPFVPVARSYETYGDDEPAETDIHEPEPESEPRPRQRRRGARLPQIRPAWAVRWDMLLLVGLLIAAGVAGTLLVRGDVSETVRAWWPGALAAFAGIWMLIALLRQNVASFLGATAFAGIGLSLLMDTQDIAAFEETLLGVVLVTVGLGIVIRGFLLRQRAQY